MRPQALPEGVVGVEVPGNRLRVCQRRLLPIVVKRRILAIAAMAGIESFVWLVDVGGVDRQTAAAVIKSSCGALLEHELRG